MKKIVVAIILALIIWNVTLSVRSNGIPRFPSLAIYVRNVK